VELVVSLMNLVEVDCRICNLLHPEAESSLRVRKEMPVEIQAVAVALEAGAPGSRDSDSWLLATA
jgi:hypothetical protein